MVRERESHLLASAKQWEKRGCGERERESPICWLLQNSGGKGVVERERETFAGFCKAVGGKRLW